MAGRCYKAQKQVRKYLHFISHCTHYDDVMVGALAQNLVRMNVRLPPLGRELKLLQSVKMPFHLANWYKTFKDGISITTDTRLGEEPRALEQREVEDPVLKRWQMEKLVPHQDSC